MIKIIILFYTLKFFSCQIFNEWLITTDNDLNIKIDDLLNFDTIVSINKVRLNKKIKFKLFISEDF